MNLQRTLKRSVAIQGVGLHSGTSVQLTIHPARPNRGIRFVRTDIENSPEIEAKFQNVICTRLATTLGVGKVTVSTVEHLLAALAGMNIDNALVEVDGPELPILDGSSEPFCKVLRNAGFESQLVSRPILFIRKRIEVKLAEKWAVVEPSARFEIHGSIEWDHPSIGYQEFHYQDGVTPFDDLAFARTFCLLKDVEAMKRAGLARGGSLENAVVLDDALVLNPDGLRSPDELVRHKILDAVGDFKLAGIPICGYVRLHRAGHELHHRLVQEIFSNPDHYEIIDIHPSKVVEEPAIATAAALAVMAASGSWVASS